MHHPTDRIAHTTAFVTPVVEHWLEREIAQWVHPMKDRSDDPSHHEQTRLPRSYISLPEVENVSLKFMNASKLRAEVKHAHYGAGLQTRTHRLAIPPSANHTSSLWTGSLGEGNECVRRIHMVGISRILFILEIMGRDNSQSSSIPKDWYKSD